MWTQNFWEKDNKRNIYVKKGVCRRLINQKIGKNQNIMRSIKGDSDTKTNKVGNITLRFWIICASIVKGRFENTPQRYGSEDHDLSWAKDARNLLASGFVCLYGCVYFGTTKHSASMHIAEHRQPCRLGEWKKSELVEHSLSNSDLCSMVYGKKILSSTLHREMMEIQAYNKQV